MVNILWTRAGFWSRFLVYALLLAAAVFTIVPFLWAAINSIKTSDRDVPARCLHPVPAVRADARTRGGRC